MTNRPSSYKKFTASTLAAMIVLCAPGLVPYQALAANVFALLVHCGAKGAQADPLQALPHLCAAALQVGDQSTGTGS